MSGLPFGSVKICSLREVEHARYVLDAGADLYGLIFVPGRRRYVAPDQAKAIVQAVRDQAAGKPPLAVGVFVDAAATEISAVSDTVGLDLIQLHGHEPPEFLAELALPAIKVLGLGPDDTIETVCARIEGYMRARVRPAGLLIDGEQGGMGKKVDWTIAAEIARRWPVMLAGGLTPENVAEAISSVGPSGVDVGSGVETDGLKDAAKIASFVANARRAFFHANVSSGS